jgi:hypothetical protein
VNSLKILNQEYEGDSLSQAILGQIKAQKQMCTLKPLERLDMYSEAAEHGSAGSLR